MEHTVTALPLVAPYNGYRNNDDYDLMHCINGNGAESRIEDRITANHHASEARDNASGTNSRIEGLRTHQTLTDKEIYDVAKTVLMDGARTREASAAQYAAIQLKQAEDTSAIQLEAAKNLAAITLDACKNNSAILAAIAECCCEQKNLTIAQGAETRQLINGNTIQALQSELAAANLALALKK